VKYRHLLVVCDPDGKNARIVATRAAAPDAIAGVDWR
jgi:hypothetical protein